jgi:hypothetical protein
LTIDAPSDDDKVLARLRHELAGWHVWNTLNYVQRDHTWSAMPDGAPIAEVIQNDPDLLVTACRQYEADLGEHILATQRALDREADTATPERLRLLHALRTAQMGLRVHLVARQNEITIPHQAPVAVWSPRHG